MVVQWTVQREDQKEREYIAAYLLQNQSSDYQSATDLERIKPIASSIT